MRLSETKTLLDEIAGFDGRTFAATAASAWHSVLGPYPLDDALRAVREHYATNTDRVMPADVRHRCLILRQLRDAEAQRALPAPTAPVLTEAGRAARAQVFAQIRQVATRMDREMARTMRADSTAPTSADSEITDDVRSQWLDRLAAAS